MTLSKPRGVLIAGNWKMNHGQAELLRFAESVHGKLAAHSRLQTALAVPYLLLEKAVTAFGPVGIRVAAQSAHWEKSGAFTGEVSGPMLKEIGVSSTLIAHSERRQFFGETDETARKRTESLLEQGFQVIFCVGETRAEREGGQTKAVLTRQIQALLPNAQAKAAAYLDGRLVVAYEPVWAIGTGLTATPEQAEEAHQIIRRLLWDSCGMDASGRTPILYGGSVTPENVAKLLSCANIDGALVGGASLKPESWLALVAAGAAAAAG